MNSSYELDYQPKTICLDNYNPYHGPICGAFTDVEDEPTDHFFSPRRVGYFWVELDSVERFGVVCDCGEWSCTRLADNVKVGGDLGELVAVGHPYLYLELETNT